jgi:hypothetical protein
MQQEKVWSEEKQQLTIKAHEVEEQVLSDSKRQMSSMQRRQRQLERDYEQLRTQHQDLQVG